MKLVVQKNHLQGKILYRSPVKTYNPFSKIFQNFQNLNFLNFFLTLPQTEWSGAFHQFVSGLLKKTPSERLSAHEALEHQWLKDNKENPTELIELIRRTKRMVEEQENSQVDFFRHFSNFFRNFSTFLEIFSNFFRHFSKFFRNFSTFFRHFSKFFRHFFEIFRHFSKFLDF
mgnify:CR=1 FL=1